MVFGCPTTSFGSLLKEHPHLTDANHYVLSLFDPKVTEKIRNEVKSPSLPEYLVGFNPGTDSITAT